MNVKQAIKLIEGDAAVLVYELYNRKLDRKTGGIYHNYDECITGNFFDVNEFEFMLAPVEYNKNLFDNGLLIAHTHDYNWYIVATRLQ